MDNPQRSKADGTTDYIADFVEQQQVQYAGFWLRVVAILIDTIVLSIAESIMHKLTGYSFRIDFTEDGWWFDSMVDEASSTSGLLALAYYTIMESSGYQATLGKMVLGLKVTDLNGGRISIWKALGRYICKFISAIIFLIGFMMAGWTQRKQALHDLIMGTLVVVK